MTDRCSLVRHGQSEWNLKNLFTGWRDLDLTEKGVEGSARRRPQAEGARLSFDVAFTSALKRAQHTLDLILDEMGRPDSDHQGPSAQRTRLRRSGGLNKDDARKKWGEEQVLIWRRSYDVPPPGGESLKDTRRARCPITCGDPAARAARQDRSGRRARQFAARARHGDREADARADPEARTRDRRADNLSAQCRVTVAAKLDLAA